ncbi:hypothetical protein BKA70DRAFT_1423073 [Coprinopsis sp. MPI-PUGE-AT-0042]|nr:hypothetical protein BKA70DRAFT_1423073 [Coprinopsis sp. MPI-PUGE-AT-0042]
MAKATQSDWDAYYRIWEDYEFFQIVALVAFQTVQGFIVIDASSTFFETPKDQRQGRFRFIVISWVILALSSFHVMVILAMSFKGYRRNADHKISKSDFHVRNLSSAAHTLVVATGDFLMVPINIETICCANAYLFLAVMAGLAFITKTKVPL